MFTDKDCILLPEILDIIAERNNIQTFALRSIYAVRMFELDEGCYHRELYDRFESEATVSRLVIFSKATQEKFVN